MSQIVELVEIGMMDVVVVVVPYLVSFVIEFVLVVDVLFVTSGYFEQI